MKEMKRLCLPTKNIVLERQEFKKIEQEENEKINKFESRVRSKAQQCEFETCECAQVCKKCSYDRETDEIKIQILCNMKNKDLQKELWRKHKDYNTLEEIVDAIRASEAAEDHQNSIVGQTKEPTKVMKCYNCDKLGHKAASCPTKKAAEKPASQSLNF